MPDIDVIDLVNPQTQEIEHLPFIPEPLIKFRVRTLHQRVILDIGPQSFAFNIKSARTLSRLLAQRANEAAAQARKD